MHIDLRAEYKKAKLLVIFSDGACLGNPGPGGWGSVVFWPDQTVEELGGSEPQTTNNRMELMALIRALERIQSAPLPDGAVVQIFSDSNYALQGIQKWIHGWKRNGWKNGDGKPVSNQDLWERLDANQAGLSKKHLLKWNWIKGHAALPGNERCDEIATSFARNEEAELYTGPAMQRVDHLTWEDPGEKDPVYLSLVAGVLERHATWSECERRVKGQRGAKYRKALNSSDAKKILKEWGVSEVESE